MNRPSIRTVAIVSLLSVAAALLARPAAAAPPVETLVPADAELVWVIRDAAQLRSQLDAGLLGTLWHDPEVQAFLAPMRDELEVGSWDQKLREETGYDLAGLLELATGGVAFYLPSIEEMVHSVASEDEAAPFPFVMLVSAGARAEELEKLLLDQEEKERREADADEDPSRVDVEREYREVTLHVERHVDLDEPRDQESWARIGEVLAFAGSADSLEGVVDRVLDGASDGGPFAAPTRAAAGAALASADAFMLADLTPLAPMIRQVVAATAGDDPEAPPVDYQAMLSAFGLDSLETAYAGLDLAGGAVTWDLGLTAARNDGLLKLMALGPGKAPQPSIVPLSASSFGATQFDVAAAWQALTEIMNAIEPSLLAMGAQQLAAFQQQAGVELDLKGDLLENLSGEIVGIEVPGEDDREAGGADTDTAAAAPVRQDQVIALSIRDRTGLERLLTGLKSAAGAGSELFEERDFLGTTIYTLATVPPGGASVGYAVTDHYLLISISTAGHQTLEAVLIAASRPGESAWQRDDVRAALAALPAGSQSIQFTEPEAALRMIISVLEALAAVEGEDGSLCDPAAAPDPARLARHLGPLVAGWHKDGGHLALRMQLQPAAGGAE